MNQTTSSAEIEQLPADLEQIFLDRIKVIGDGEHSYYGYPAELMAAVHEYATNKAIEARIDEHKKLAEVTQMSIGLSKSKAITAASFMLNVNDWQKYRLNELEATLQATKDNGEQSE